MDASYIGIGALLEKVDENRAPFVVEYACRTLRTTEFKYASTELECLGLEWSIEHFRHYLLGMKFEMEKDDYPLIFLKVDLNSF